MLNTSQSALVENNYATLFFDYISRSLTESLTAVRTVPSRLADEERVQACHVLDYGLRATQNWPETRDLAVALAPYVERSGDWENWRHQLQHAIDLAEQLQDVEGKIGLMVYFARLAQRQGRLAETIYYYRRVIRLARQTGNRFQEARACSNLGYALIESGHFLRSEILCQHALVIFTELQSNHGLAHTHNHIGSLYIKQKYYETAEHHLKLACEIWQQMQDDHGLFYGNLNLGLLYLEIDLPDQSLHHLGLALLIAENSGEAVGVARIWNNIGRVHLKVSNFNRAEQYFEKARTLFLQIGDTHELAKTHHNLGLTYQHLQKWQDALYHLEVALSLFQTSQNKIDAMKVLVALVTPEVDQAYAISSERHMQTLAELVAQQNTDGFHHVFQDFVIQYCSSLPGTNSRKLLQLAVT